MKRIYIKCFILALIAILLELFVFNFRTFESMTFTSVDSLTLAAPDGQPLEAGQTVTFADKESTEIIIAPIDAVAGNIYIDAEDMAAPKATLTFSLWARDEGNNQYYRLPKMNIAPGDEGSKYIRLNLSGKAKSIKIEFKNLSSDTVKINDIGINRLRPLDFSILRLAAIYILLLVVYSFRPGSALYRIPYQIKDSRQKGLIVILLLIQLTVAAGVTLGNKTYCDPPWVHHYQYHELAVSISKGHFYLDTQPSKELMAMENPYDSNERGALDVDCQWDTAYYNGKYYSYFGVLPVFVYYLPYYLVTGQAFPTFVGIIINCAAIIAGVFFLLDALVRKYFRHTSLGLFAVLLVLLTLGCGLLLIVNPPTFYNMPVSMALALTLWGLYFWQKAVRENVCGENDCGQNVPDKDGTKVLAKDSASSENISPGSVFISKRFLVLGALCMALVAPCRPQMLVGSFLAIPIFLKPFCQYLKVSKKQALVSLAAAAVPYIIVAALLMYYNYARFGSPFDFGANYNLTTNDMTHRGFHLDRLPFGLFMYLFQTPEFVGRAPFMTATSITTSYQGTTIAETMYGGFFWFNIITAALLFLGNVRTLLRKKGLGILCAMSIILALVVICADIQMAGILQRYGCDFGLFLTLPAVIITLALHERLAAHLQKTAPKLSKRSALKSRAGLENIFYKVLMWIFLLTCAINFLWLCAK